MGLRFGAARALSAASTWGLKHIFRRPAANFPGKVALYADPDLIGDLSGRIEEGSVVVVGTNGKTTVTNMLADAFTAAGKTVACNREGANLDSGIATALLHAGQADWGVFESDELWLSKVLPELKPDYVVLLNLFRDQLDRVGEIDRIQSSIAEAIAHSPRTQLVYNADDPFCQAIADSVGNTCVPYGIDGDLGLEQNTVADSGMCQRCEGMLRYAWRQYGQMGAYRCDRCGFARAEPLYRARDVTLSESGATFSLESGEGCEVVRTSFPGAYMIYNVLAVHTVARLCGISSEATSRAVADFDPGNGRLQRYEVDGKPILLNLAKNPAGFNQNLRIIMQEPGPKAVALFINDKEADGHDVSWLWDVDFQELARNGETSTFAGGIRRNDMQVRLKYAGIKAPLVNSAQDFAAQAQAAAPDAKLFLIANYTALPAVKDELDHMEHLPAPQSGPIAGKANAPTQADPPIKASSTKSRQPAQASSTHSRLQFQERPLTRPSSDPRIEQAAEKLVIVHALPSLLNLYGDGGNVIVLADRARRRGIDVTVVRTGHGEPIDFPSADIVFIGGGPDREQRLAAKDLIAQASEAREYVEDDGVLLAICGGFQIIGRTWLLDDETVEGMGLVDVDTGRAEGGSLDRLVGNIMIESPVASLPVVGYENHAGRTRLDARCHPFGRIIGRHGRGNDGMSGEDGVMYRNVVGTYLHGPLLAKNPEVADWLIERALQRRAVKEGRDPMTLPPLDDEEERAANEFMQRKIRAGMR